MQRYLKLVFGHLTMKLGGLSLCTIGAGVKGLLVRKKEGSKVFHLKRCRD